MSGVILPGQPEPKGPDVDEKINILANQFVQLAQRQSAIEELLRDVTLHLAVTFGFVELDGSEEQPEDEGESA